MISCNSLQKFPKYTLGLIIILILSGHQIVDKNKHIFQKSLTNLCFKKFLNLRYGNSTFFSPFGNLISSYVNIITTKTQKKL